MPGAHRRTTVTVAVLLVVFSSGQRPATAELSVPTEPMVLVRSAEAPLLGELKPKKDAGDVGRAGELLLLARPLPPMDSGWKGKMGFDGPVAERSGPMAEVRRAAGGGIFFAFSADLGDTLEVPTAASLCERIATQAPTTDAARQAKCPSILQRAQLPSGAIVAFEPCMFGPCSVALWRKDRFATLTVDGVLSGRVVAGGADGVLLLTTRWNRDKGTWTGGTLVPVALSGDVPGRLPDIAVDEVDARDAAQVSEREVTVKISAPEPAKSLVHVTGRHRVRSRVDRRELSSTPVDERHNLP